MNSVTQAFQTGWGLVNNFFQTPACQLGAAIGSVCVGVGSVALACKEIRKLNSNQRDVAVKTGQLQEQHPSLKEDIQELSEKVDASIKTRKLSSYIGMVASVTNVTNSVITLTMLNLSKNSTLNLAHSVLGKFSYGVTATVNFINGGIQLYSCYREIREARNPDSNDQSKEVHKRHAKDKALQTITTFCISSGAIASLALLNPSAAMWTAVVGGTLSLVSDFCSRRKIRHHAKAHIENLDVHRARMVSRPSSSGKVMTDIINNINRPPSLSPTVAASPSSPSSPFSLEMSRLSPNPSSPSTPQEQQVLIVGEGLPSLEQAEQELSPGPLVGASSPMPVIEEGEEILV